MMTLEIEPCCICGEKAYGYIEVQSGWRDKEHNRLFLCKWDYVTRFQAFYPEWHKLEDTTTT